MLVPLKGIFEGGRGKERQNVRTKNYWNFSWEPLREFKWLVFLFFSTSAPSGAHPIVQLGGISA